MALREWARRAVESACSSRCVARAAAFSTATAAKQTATAARQQGPAEAPSFSAIFLFVPSALCGTLAYWQYERSRWKTSLIELRQDMLQGSPADIYSVDEPQPYQFVTASGVLQHEASFFVGPRPRNIPGAGVQSGFIVITPLYDPVRRGVVLVNRGWVPAAWYENWTQLRKAHDTIPDPAATASDTAPRTSTASTATSTSASSISGAGSSGGAKPPASSLFSWLWGSKKGGAAGAPAGGTGAGGASSVAAAAAPAAVAVTRVVGIVQPNEEPSSFVPDNKPERDEFHWIDVATMAKACGLPPDTPLVQTISDDPATAAPKPAGPLEASRAGLGPEDLPPFPIPKNRGDFLRFTTMPQDHINYAMTWAVLCVVLAVMARQAILSPPKSIRMVGEANQGLRAWQANSLGK